MVVFRILIKYLNLLKRKNIRCDFYKCIFRMKKKYRVYK